MGRRRNYGRPVNGIIVLDKPAGVTSNALLQQAKRTYFANKAGHTGSLDPLATGVLPICLGEATKFSQYLLDSDKGYISTFILGAQTDTADADGEIQATQDASHITRDDVESILAQYRGDIMQVPPMYSALKHNGQPLYKLARKGVEVEIKPRAVTIYEFELLDFRPGQLAQVDVKVLCSKGTYIRSLAVDIGHDLNVGGHVSVLRRTQAGAFTLEHAHTIESLEAERGEQQAHVLDHHLMPMDKAIDDLPKLDLDDSSAHYFMQGQAVMDGRVYRLGDEGDTIRVFNEQGQFYGIGTITDEGTVAPKRLVNYT